MKSLQIQLAFNLLTILHAHEISYGLRLLNVPNTTYNSIPLFHIPVDSLKNPTFITMLSDDFPKHAGPLLHNALLSPVLCSAAARLAFSPKWFLLHSQSTI